MSRREGMYRATVMSISDPESRGRVKVRCRQLWGDGQVWAWPCVPAGSSALPSVGDQVWLGFEAADEDHPVWLGTLGAFT